MMKLSLTITGLKELIKGLSNAKSNLASEISSGLREAAFVVEGEGKKAITTGATRAIKTGYLRSSIGVKSVTAWKAVVEAGAYYGIYVHEGTRFMRARPFLEVGTKNAVPQIERIFGRRVSTLIKIS